MRIELEQQVGARQLAIEVLGEPVGARVQRRVHALAFRVADAAEPLVLQRREQRDQPEQGARHDDHRQPESASHAASLARRFPGEIRAGRRFYVLNKLFART